MEKTQLILIATIISYGAFAGVDSKMNKWFQDSQCSKMDVLLYKSASDHTLKKQVNLTDPEYVMWIKNKIEQLPTAGDEMTKMGPNAAYMVLDFSCKTGQRQIEFYNHSIKLPDTSFLSDQKSIQMQTVIWDEIQSLLDEPKLGKNIPMAVGLKHRIADFTIEFNGSEDRTPTGTTASHYVGLFTLAAEKPEVVTKLEVHSGQLPPRDVEFKVGKKNYILSTYTDQTGGRVKPNKFLIYEKKN